MHEVVVGDNVCDWYTMSGSRNQPLTSTAGTTTRGDAQDTGTGDGRRQGGATAGAATATSASIVKPQSSVRLWLPVNNIALTARTAAGAARRRSARRIETTDAISGGVTETATNSCRLPFA